MDIDLKAVLAAYETAGFGSEKPSHMMMSAEGLRQFAQRLPDPDEREKYTTFANECPTGYAILFSESGMSYAELRVI